MKTLLIPFLLFSNVFTGFSQTTGDISESCEAKIDSTYTSLLNKTKTVGASIAIVKDGKVIYANGFGYQDKENEILADENTVYRIGSCTKSFTSLSVLQLQERTLLRIEDPIQKYIPELHLQDKYGIERNMQIKSFMAHTSGLPSDILNGFFCDNPPSSDWLIEQLNHCALVSPENYQHSYSNVGYSLLGKLIENVSNVDYSEYLKKNVFEPLNMNATFVDNGTFRSSGFSKGYLKGKECEEVLIRDQAAGTIASSAMDMAKYINMFLANGNVNGQQIVSEDALTEMKKSATANIVLPTSTDWGLGLYSKKIYFSTDTDTTELTMIGHGGDTWVYHSDFVFIPEMNLGAVILTNTESGTGMVNSKKLLELYLKEMTGLKPINVKKEVSNREEGLCLKSDIVGDYFFGGIHMKVKNKKKIKFNQGPIRIILSPKNDALVYSAKSRVFHFIPMKIKNQEFKFVEYQGDVYFKIFFPKSGNEVYESIKNQKNEISESWEDKWGKYELVGDYFPCTDCPYFNFEGIEIKLTEKDGYLKVNLKSDDKKNGVKGYQIFNPVSDSLGVSPGLGRSSGETLRVLENGNLFYNGFEFKRK